MDENQTNQLPFSSFGLVKPSTYAYARGFRFSFDLHDDRSIQFFGLIILDSNEEPNAKVADEIVSRIKDTVTYQKDLLEGNKISVTNEDFFEQCLQKANNELGIFLRDIDISLSLQKWSVLIGMITESPSPLKSELYLSRFGEVTGWLLHSAQLDTKKLISIFDTPDLLAGGMIPQKFFSSIIATQVSNNDQLFFCSPNLLNHVSLSDIKHVLSTLSAQSGLKHLENQINFSPSDRVVSALTIRLSPYPILEKTKQESFNTGAESSMSNLIHTQSETEKLLGNGIGFSLGRLTNSAKQSLSSVVSRAKQTESEVVPGSTSQREQTPVSQAIATIMRISGKTLEYTQKSIVYIIKKSPKPKGSQLDTLAKNRTVTKVNILKKQLVDSFAPVVNRLKFYMKSNNAAGLFKLLTKPASITIIMILVAVGLGLRYTKNQYDSRQEVLAYAESTLEDVKTNLDQIDSYLIVGRESDAITLLQTSLSKLEVIQSEEHLSQKDEFIAQLAQRQSTLRKETVITNAEVIVEDLSVLLPSPAREIVQAGDEFIIIPENPKNYLSLSTPTESKPLTSDLPSWTGATFISKTLALLGENTISQGQLTDEAFQSASTSVREPFVSASNYNNRLYTLAPSINQILKSNTLPNFSVMSPWIQDANPNLADARDLGIDGSIYVLYPNRIDLYRQGFLAKPNISLDAVDPALDNAIKLQVTDESNKIFILEADRLLEYEKSGRFRQQYLVPGQNFKDFYVDNQQRIVYLLTDNQVLKFSL